jgi:hypothetical protein
MAFRKGWAAPAVLGALALLAGACGSSKNNGANTGAAPPSASAAASARAAAATQRSTSPPPPAGSRTPGTLSPVGTPDPALQELAKRVSPLLLQSSDLAPAMQSWPTAVLPVSNALYGQGRPQQAEIQNRLEKDGSNGSVVASWSMTGQFQPGQKTTYQLADSLTEFKAPDGAKDGLALIFMDVNNTATNVPGDTISSAPLDAGSCGDESKAYRIDRVFTALAGTPTPVAVRTTQVTFIAGCRRGRAVFSVQLQALNQDPSLDELKRLVQLQDQRLKDAGY